MIWRRKDENMGITKETLMRSLRTFIQAALSYLLVSLAAVDFTQEGEAIKSLLLGTAVSALAAGFAAIMNLEMPKDFGGGELTFDKWAKQFSGKKLDTDGVAGVQCVDLIKHYCRNVIGIEKSYSDAWGNAIEWYNDFEKKPWLRNNFKRLEYSKWLNFQKGDIVVFKSASKYGHIAVCSGSQSEKGFEAYDENYKGTHSGMTLRTFDFGGSYKPLGVLRPKDRSNILIPPKVKEGTYKLTNVRGIYNACGSDSGRKLVKNISEDAKKNAVCKKNNAEAFLTAGTKVTVKEVKQLSSGNLWAKIPSGYICIWEMEKDKLFLK